MPFININKSFINIKKSFINIKKCSFCPLWPSINQNRSDKANLSDLQVVTFHTIFCTTEYLP